MQLSKLLIVAAFSMTKILMFGQQTELKPLVQKVNHRQTDWFLEMQSQHPNWFKVNELQRNYFLKHPYERSHERRRCERWLQVMRPHLNTEGVVEKPIFREADFASKTFLSNRDNGNDMTGSWRMIGPFHEQKSCNGAGNAPMPGGFCDRVYINPYNTNNMYSAQSYGGLWVSKDKGASWKLTDAAFPNGTNTYANRDYYYGEIEANKLNSSLIYAATEAGLLKSINGGDAWTLCPQLNRAANANLRPYFVAQANDNQITVLSTFGTKLFRSNDAGQTWTLAFDNSTGGALRTGTNQHAGQPFGLYDRTYNFWGLTNHPTKNNVFYLGAINNANQACVYKSTDNGVTFTLLVNINTKIGKNLKYIQLKTIAGAPDKFIVYNLFDKDAMYKFNENGDLVTTTSNQQQPYFEAFDVDWLDENKVYNSFYGIFHIAKSNDGGQSFTDTRGDCNVEVHYDPRSISAVGDLVLIGTDGGIYLSTDGGKTYPSVGDDISAIDLWGFSSSFKSDVLLVGCDHGPNMLRTADTDRNWREVLGADAGASTINPANENLMYLDWGYGKSRGELQPNGTLTLSPTTNEINFQRIEFNPLNYSISYGMVGDSVKISTDNLATNRLFYKFGQPVSQFKIALKDTNVMYVLLKNNIVRRSQDGGKNWSDITPNIIVSKNQTNIVAIESGKNPQELWVVFGNQQNACKVLKSNDFGTNWTDLTGNLPNSAIQFATYQRGTEGGIYVAMQGNGGVWYRNNTLTEWKPLGQGLPMLGYVQQTYTIPAKNKFRMGSSRGSFEHELFESSNLDAHFSANTRAVTCNDVVNFRDYSAYSNTSNVKFAWTFAGGSPATSTLENPKVSYQNAAVGKYDVSLTLTDASGKTSSYTVKNFMEVTDKSACQISGTAGKAMDLSGAKGSANLPSLPIKALPFTMTMWVKPTVLQKSFSQIISQSGTPRSSNLPHFGVGFAFKGYAANTNLVFTGKDIDYNLTTTHDLPLSIWSHLAVVVEATKVTLYKDGNPWVYTGAFPAPDFEQYPLVINADIHSQGGDFKGILDEIAIYNTALSQDAIRETMHLTKTGNEPNLVAYYQFNQYANNKVFDLKGGYNLSDIGVALITPNSTAPVASGVSKKRLGNTTNLDFTNTNMSAQLSSTSANEFVGFRLDAAPDGSPNAVSNVKKYWILRSWGTDSEAQNKLNSLTFNNLGLKPATVKLFSRNANAEANTWVNSNISATGNLTFEIQNKGVFNSQITITGDTINTSVLELNGQIIGVKAYPNPTKDVVELSFGKVENALDVEVVLSDMLGKNLQQKSLRIDASESKASLDLGGYASGIYVVFVRYKGQVVGSLRVSKI
jgi:photosystem II stability/assembly factor-like uncharacterized protein